MNDKQKIINFKICWVLFVLILEVNSYKHRFKQRSTMIRQLQDLLDNDDQEFELTRRYKQHEDDELNSDSRTFDEADQYMEIRATKSSNDTNTGIEITLQNRAAMNTRLRVLYTDSNGNPAIAETGRVFGGRTKSVTLPLGAKNINIIIEKDIFFENWRVAYKGTLTNENQCIRITGVTLISKTHSCN